MTEEVKQAKRPDPYERIRLERGLFEFVNKAAGTKHYVLRLQTAEGRKPIRLKAANRAQAREEAAKVRARVADKTFVAPSPMTFEALFAKWKSEKEARVASGDYATRTIENVEGALKTWAKPIWQKKVTDITRANVLAIRNAVRKEGRSTERQDSVVDAISTVLQFGVDQEEVLSRNVARGIPKQLRTKVKALRKPYVPSTDEVNAILDAAPKGYETYLLALADLGVRDGECRGLRWGSFDREANVMHVTVQSSRDGSGLTKLKTDGSERTVPLTARLRAALIELELASRNTGENDLIFTDERGKGLTYINTLRAFRRAVKKAKVEKGECRLALHSLRHSFASRLLADGVPVARVSAWLGHSKVSTTWNSYAHAIPSGDSNDDGHVLTRALAGGAS